MALIVLEKVKEKEQQLEGVSKNVSNQQKQDELKKTLNKAMKNHKVSPNSLALILSTTNQSLNMKTSSGKEFIRVLPNLLLTNSQNNTRKSTKVGEVNKTVISNSPKYNSLTFENKKKVVEKLQKAIKKGNTEAKKKRIQEIAVQLNSNIPKHITTIDEFEREIIKRFKPQKPKQFILNGEEETKLIQELSRNYMTNKKMTEAKQKQYLDKILYIISEIKTNNSIKSLTEFKQDVQKKLNQK
jgi:hypothetical protein